MKYVLIGLPLWFLSLWVLLRANHRVHKLPSPTPTKALNDGITRWQAARAADDAIEQADINATLARYEKTL